MCAPRLRRCAPLLPTDVPVESLVTGLPSFASSPVNRFPSRSVRCAAFVMVVNLRVS
jgi:hypothetical protein